MCSIKADETKFLRPRDKPGQPSVAKAFSAAVPSHEAAEELDDEDDVHERPVDVTAPPAPVTQAELAPPGIPV
jgi:hypothetical protein